MTKLLWASVFAASVSVLACGDDDDSGCPDGTTPGTTVDCTCDDAATGTQSCMDNGTATACDCSSDPGDRDEDDDQDSRDRQDSGVGQDGEDSGTTDDDDADDDDADGGHLAPCQSNEDCDDGLGCYGAGSGLRGYCSVTCRPPGSGPGGNRGRGDRGPRRMAEEDADDPCAAIPGGRYTCSPSSGVCRLQCESNNDSNCPEGMECVNVRGDGWRCLPEETAPPPGDGEPFDACEGDRDCGTDLTCLIPLGYCAEQCAIDSHCTAGGICMRQLNVCVVRCEDDASCSDGLTCRDVRSDPGQLLLCGRN